MFPQFRLEDGVDWGRERRVHGLREHGLRDHTIRLDIVSQTKAKEIDEKLTYLKQVDSHVPLSSVREYLIG